MESIVFRFCTRTGTLLISSPGRFSSPLYGTIKSRKRPTTTSRITFPLLRTRFLYQESLSLLIRKSISRTLFWVLFFNTRMSQCVGIVPIWKKTTMIMHRYYSSQRRHLTSEGAWKANNRLTSLCVLCSPRLHPTIISRNTHVDSAYIQELNSSALCVCARS